MANSSSQGTGPPKIIQVMAGKDNSNYESFFTYNVSRAYPYRWLTPTVVIGGLICTVLFSFLNFAANSYDLVVHTTNDLNATLAGPSLLHNWPLYFRDKVQTTCEPATIPVGSQLFTNQTALVYDVVGISQVSSDGANTSIVSSMPYSSNVIQNCSVQSIGMDISSLDRSPSQIFFSEWGLTATTYLGCAFDGINGVVNFNLSQTYDLIPPRTYWSEGYSRSAFLETNNQTRASLYWGESALANYWVGIVSAMGDIAYNVSQSGQAAITLGSLFFFPSGNTTDIKDLGFFDIFYDFTIDLGLGNVSDVRDLDYPTIAELAQAETYPNIWILADSFAKSLYSTVMTDLGQMQAKSNFLVNADDLQYFTSNFTQILNVSEIWPGTVAEEDYDTLKDETGPLRITPSVFSSQYICQIPELKSAGDIIVSILVADLVFLQTTWTIFTFVLGLYSSTPAEQTSVMQNSDGYRSVEIAGDK